MLFQGENNENKFQTLIDRLNTSSISVTMIPLISFQTLIDRLNTMKMDITMHSHENFKPL